MSGDSHYNGNGNFFFFDIKDKQTFIVLKFVRIWHNRPSGIVAKVLSLNAFIKGTLTQAFLPRNREAKMKRAAARTKERTREGAEGFSLHLSLEAAEHATYPGTKSSCALPVEKVGLP